MSDPSASAAGERDLFVDYATQHNIEDIEGHITALNEKVKDTFEWPAAPPAELEFHGNTSTKWQVTTGRGAHNHWGVGPPQVGAAELGGYGRKVFEPDNAHQAGRG